MPRSKFWRRTNAKQSRSAVSVSDRPTGVDDLRLIASGVADVVGSTVRAKLEILTLRRPRTVCRYDLGAERAVGGGVGCNDRNGAGGREKGCCSAPC